MKKTAIPFLAIALFVLGANSQEKGPFAISPGNETGIARVGDNCPTFSWTVMEWATGYKVVVFETNGSNVLDYKEMVAIASPVLTKEIKGCALSWTPSSEERLRSGSMYVWYVQAVDSYGQGMWSGGRIFKVEAEVQLAGIEDAVRKSLRKRGMSEEVIEDALEDMKSEVREVVVWGVDAKEREGATQDEVGIQGYEGSFNTFYGLDAGFNTTGDYNSFFGRQAGYYNTTGYRNTFIGFNSGIDNTEGNENSFLGFLAGRNNTTGGFNTFMGTYAGWANTTGSYNIFLGNHSGHSNTSGFNNVFLGEEAGYKNTAGYCNTYIGRLAGFENTTGAWNLFLGYHSGNNNSSGYFNVYVGPSAGYNNTSGSGNLFLGFSAGYNETGSNRLYIDNSNTSFPLIWGDFSSNILTVHGKLGVGTKSPAYAMELETTGENAAFVAQRTDGATNYINATAGFGNFGTVTNHPLRLAVNSVWRMRLDSDNSLTMANGAMCTAGGTWQNYSRREAKENIHDLTAEEAMDTLERLVAVKYNYKVDKEEKHVGFIAEDVPEMVASKDRNGISAMDIVAVLTKVVQEQQRLVEEQQKTILELQKQIDELKTGEK